MAIRRRMKIDGRELDILAVSRNSSFFTGSTTNVMMYGSKKTKEHPEPSLGIISMINQAVSTKLELKPVFRRDNLANLIDDGVVDYRKLNAILINNIRRRDPPFQMYAQYFKSNDDSFDEGHWRFDYVAGSTDLLLVYLGVSQEDKYTCKYSIMLSPVFNDANLLKELMFLVGSNSDGEVIGKCLRIGEKPSFLNGSIFDVCIKDSNHFNSKEYFGLGTNIDSDISLLLNEVSFNHPISASLDIESYDSLCDYFSNQLSLCSDSERKKRALISIASVFYRIGITQDPVLGKYTFKPLPYGQID